MVAGYPRWDALVRTGARGYAWREASDAAQRMLLARQVDRLRTWYEDADRWNQDWRAAAFSTDTVILLTPAELTQLAEQVSEVVHRWTEQSRHSIERGGAQADVERSQVFFFAHGFPIEPTERTLQSAVPPPRT